MNRSALSPFLVPLSLLLGAHLLWLYICGGFRVLYEFLQAIPCILGF